MRVDVYIHHQDEQDSQFIQIINLLTEIKHQGAKILMNEQLVKDALAKIDAATTQTATIVAASAETLTVIETDTLALQAALAAALANGTGVTQELVDQATALADRSSTTSESLAALVPVLQRIASEGVQNPVPVPVPAA